MTNAQLNMYLLKEQQARIEELKKENEYFRDLCSKLSQPIDKTK